MILEGIVTTLNEHGQVNIAPMGPHLPDTNPPWTHFQLKPFNSSQTYQNLMQHGEGVLHVTDDVLLLAQAAIGTPCPIPTMRKASAINGSILVDCCRYYEFRVLSNDGKQPRPTMAVEVVHTEIVREFFGFNRAKHAVLEAAILATRIGLLPRSEIESEFERLAVIVKKTGGQQEHQAFAHLKCAIEKHGETTCE